MKINDLSGKHRTWYRWTGCIAAGLLTVALAGCGGGGSDTTAAAPAAGGTTTPATAAADIATASALAANDTATTPTAAFTVVSDAGIAPVTIASPPKVNFTVVSDGAVVKGLTASNVSFIIAKLVPGTNGAPDQWVSYTNRTETATATVGPGGKPVLASATQATTDAKQTDAALLAAQVAYNDAGYYTYTFSTDIKDTAQTNGVAFDASATHRVAIQLSYTNKAGATVRVNPYFDFTIDASGNAVAVTDTSKTRKVVDIASCNECHSALALHGGGRVDTQYCVLCHNSGTTDANSGNVVDLGIMVHKIHAGEHLKAWFGESYTIWGYRDAEHDYAEVKYPQTLTNCTKCHDNSKAAQADNWKSVPSRAACGACHAGIDFAKNTGVTLADAAKGLTSSSIAHIGGAKADDTQCVICHGTAEIPVYHVTVARSWNSSFTTLTQYAGQKSPPAGAAKFSYEIASVAVSGTPAKASVKFRILKDGTPVTFNTFTTGGTALLTGFTGGPSIYVAMAIPQDGIAAPTDFNKYFSRSVQQLWDGTGGTLSARDADGYYTAVLGGGLTSTSYDIPTNAVMVTALMGYGSFTQTMSDTVKYPNGLQVPGQAVQMVATGYTARRDIVANAKCNACHEQINLFTESVVHSGNRNDAAGCAICHNPNRGSSNGWSGDSSSFFHAIHAAGMRTNDFTRNETYKFWEIGYPGVLKNCETCHVAGSYDFSATANAAAVSSRLYRTAIAGTPSTTATLFSPDVDKTKTYGASYSTSTGVAGANVGGEGVEANLVNSPIANACFACHDSSDAKTHMNQDGGGSIYQTRTVALAKTENCLFCHGSGKLVDIKVMHAQ